MYGLLLASGVACASTSNSPVIPPSITLSLSGLEHTCNGHNMLVMNSAVDLARTIKEHSTKIEREYEEISSNLQQLDLIYRPTKINPYSKLLAELSCKWAPKEESIKQMHLALSEASNKLYAILQYTYGYFDPLTLYMCEKGYTCPIQPGKLAETREFENKDAKEKVDLLKKLFDTLVLNSNSLVMYLEALYITGEHVALATYMDEHMAILQFFIKLNRNVLQSIADLYNCNGHIADICAAVVVFSRDAPSYANWNEMRVMISRIRRALNEMRTKIGDVYKCYKERDNTVLIKLLECADPQHAPLSDMDATSSQPEMAREDPAVKESSKSRNRRRRKHKQHY